MTNALNTLIETFAQATFKLMLMTTDIYLNMSIRSTIKAIEAGKDPSLMFDNVEKVIKVEGTKISLPKKNQYRVVTYSSVKMINGISTLIVDVWSDKLGDNIKFASIDDLSDSHKELFFEAITLKSNSVVLSNGPLTYPSDFEITSLRGLEIKGFKQDDGTFIIDQDKGTDILEDEYFSDVPYIERVYQITPTLETQIAYKAFPVYAITPSGTQMKDKKEHLWQVTVASKMICININKHGNIDDPTAVDLGQFNKTYTNWNEYFSSKKKVA